MDLVRGPTKPKTLDKFCPVKSVTSINSPRSAVTGPLELVTEAKGASTSTPSPELEPAVPDSFHPPSTSVQPALVQPMSSGVDSVAQPPLSKRGKKRLRKQRNCRRSQPSQRPSTDVRLSARPEVQLRLQFQGATRAASPPNPLQSVPTNGPLVGTTVQETDSSLKDYLILREKGNPGSVLVSAAPHWGSGGSARPATTLSVTKTAHGNMKGDVLDPGSSNFSKLRLLTEAVLLQSCHQALWPLPPKIRSWGAVQVHRMQLNSHSLQFAHTPP
ncbi:hypothetical protein NDU88_002770 [Pleurodeles waltl]|uniref:Uncharacterized protein n=1 Tax=Pleurodeles waltl TaxID=8319 RepID=A0AAV7LDG1_PLEWA|nr:hypothetical protein NDU88_002770 [Pleurodeles waltl]